MSAILSAALALSAPVAHAHAAAQEAAPPAFSVAPDEMGWIRLEDVVETLERATGWIVQMDAETASLVEKVHFHATGPIECGAGDVTRVFGSILASQDFVWSVVRPAAPRILSITSLDTVARGTVREDARYVPLEELGDVAGAPGLLVETLLPLPRTDVGALANSMRSYMVDPNLSRFVPAGETRALVLQGFGPGVVDLVDMLRAADGAGSGEVPLPHPPALHGAVGEYTVPSPPERADAAGMTLLDLVHLHARATGQVALIYPATARLLRRCPVTLDPPVTVADDAFPTLCEELLRAQHFVLRDLSHGDPCLYEVESLESSARPLLRMHARYVDAGSIALCERRPATLFQTLVTLPHTDVRTLSNSMRSMVVDPATYQVIPLGSSSSMILQGFGRHLPGVVRMLRRLDAANAAAAASAPEDEQGQG